MTCPHCRNNIPEGATVCTGCNAYLTTVDRSKALSCVMLLVMFALICCVWFGTFVICSNMLEPGKDNGWQIAGIAVVGLFVVPWLIFRVTVGLTPGRAVWMHRR